MKNISGKEEKKVPLWRLILHGILVLITLGMGAALVMAYVSTGVNPNQKWVFAFFGLVAPFFFLGNFILLLVWIVRWKWWAIVPAVVLVAGFGHLKALVRFQWTKEYAAEQPAKNELKVLTYNLHGFSWNKSDYSGYRENMDSIGAYIIRQSPDIICFQEYETYHAGDVEYIDGLFTEWPHRAYNFVIKGGEGIGFGLAIFSRLPIAAQERITFERSGNAMLYTDILWRADTIRVFNNHLQSAQIDADVQNRIEHLNVQETENFVRKVGSSLKRNYQKRANQVDTVARIMRDTSYPIIVTGDFNDTPVSYTYKQMRGDLKDTFIERGSGFGYTFNRLFSVLRIDYIFHSEFWQTMSYRSEKLPWSDHNPVVTLLKEKLPE